MHSFFTKKTREHEDSYQFIFICFLIACICCIHFITNLSISIDDERAAFRTDSIVWVQEGRWGAYLIEQFLFPNPSLMYWPYIFYAIVISISYFFVCKQFSGVSNYILFLIFPVFCVFPSTWVLLEFSSNTPALGLGILAVCIASALLNNEKSFTVKNSALIVSLCAFSIATYQVVIMVFYLICLASLYNNRMELNNKQIINKLCLIICYFLFSLVLYYVITWIFQSLTVSSRGYVERYVDASRLYKDFLGQVKLMLLAIYNMYFESKWRFGYDFSMLIVVLILLFVSTIINAIVKRKYILFSVFFVLNLLFIPFVINLLGQSANYPLRMYIPLGFVIWISLITLIKNSTHMKLYFLCALFCSVLLVMKNMWIISNYQTLAIISQNRETILAERIFNQILILSDNKIEKSYVIDVYGRNKGRFIFGKATTAVTESSFFSWNKENPAERISAFMTLLGYPVRPVTKTMRESNKAVFAEMKPWPHPDSIRKVDNVYLIKLSD